VVVMGIKKMLNCDRVGKKHMKVMNASGLWKGNVGSVKRDDEARL